MSIEHTFESGLVFVLSQQPYLYFSETHSDEEEMYH